MGSGSSKAKRLTAQETPDLSSRKPVANVNKPEPSSPTTESATIKSVNNNNISVDKLDRQVESPSKVAFHGNKQGRVHKDKIISGYNDNPSALQFEDDSDYNDDIDTILEIPVAVDKSKQAGNKQKKIKQTRVDQTIGADRVSKVSEYSDAPLPETYAQRLQRQQYTRQQNLLLIDKDIAKGGPEWRQDEEEEDVGTTLSRGSPQTGFDASKFRAVNRGRDFKTDVLTSAAEGPKTQHYLHSSTGHDLDDFEVNIRQDISMIKQLPQYDQSELDLMRQLEDGIW